MSLLNRYIILVDNKNRLYIIVSVQQFSERTERRRKDDRVFIALFRQNFGISAFIKIR